MKVLFVGHRNPDFPTVTEYFERAFQALGHEVCFIEYRDYLLPSRIVRSSPLAQRFEGRKLGRRFLRAARRFRPDLIFVNYGEYLPVEAVAQARSETGAFTVLWFTDFPGDAFYRHRALQVSPRYDLVTAQSTDWLTVLERKLGIDAFWLPVAADPSFHYPVEVPQTEEIWFIGSWNPRREDLLSALRDYPLTIAGPGWEQAGTMADVTILPGGQSPELQRQVYSSAAISISIHLAEPWEEVIRTQASPRVFEIVACQGFMLSDRTQDLGELFTEGAHYAGFDNAEEIREKVEYYLKHPPERQKIASNGYDHLLRHHTYEHRIRGLLEYIEEVFNYH